MERQRYLTAVAGDFLLNSLTQSWKARGCLWSVEEPYWYQS